MYLGNQVKNFIVLVQGFAGLTTDGAGVAAISLLDKGHLLGN